MKDTTINQLIKLASRAYATQASPDLYARAAAHLAASSAASDYSPECADVAALLAANALACATTLATNYSANIADLSHNKMAYLQGDDKARSSFVPRIEAQTVDRHESGYLETTERRFSAAFSVDESLAGAFEALSEGRNSSANERAKRAAFYAYSDTYAIARSAYSRAAFVARHAGNEKKGTEVFSKTMSSRLSQDLKYDYIAPGFFLEMMSSIAFKIIAGILAVAGMLAIVIGTCGLAATPIVATIPALPFATVTGAGCASATLGLGILSTSFFASRRKSQLDYENLNRMDVEPTSALQINL